MSHSAITGLHVEVLPQCAATFTNPTYSCELSFCASWLPQPELRNQSNLATVQVKAKTTHPQFLTCEPATFTVSLTPGAAPHLIATCTVALTIPPADPHSTLGVASAAESFAAGVDILRAAKIKLLFEFDLQTPTHLGSSASLPPLRVKVPITIEQAPRADPVAAWRLPHDKPQLDAQSRSATSNPLGDESLRVQDASRTPVRVLVRARPLEPGSDGAPTFVLANKTVSDDDRTYIFDGVFAAGTTNAELWARGAFDSLVESVWAGNNAAVLMYGQTASGKTHTTFGSSRDSEGLVHHAFRRLFQRRSEVDGTARISATFVEVYGEDIFDLLAPAPSSGDAARRDVRFDPVRGIFDVVGSISATIVTMEDVAQLLATGDAARRIGPSHLNDRSSRSHAVLRVKVETSSAAIVGELFFVDLCGSEALHPAVNHNETRAINLSLSHLKRVILEQSRAPLASPASTAASHSRAMRPGGFVGFRDSTLTRVLQRAIGGNARVVVVCTIAPSAANFKETRSTLQFGTLAKTVVHSTCVNRVSSKAGLPSTALVKANHDLLERVASLEMQLKAANESLGAAILQHETRNATSKTKSDPDALQKDVVADLLQVIRHQREELDALRAAPPALRNDSGNDASAIHFQVDFFASEQRLDHLVARTMQYLAGGTRIEVLSCTTTRGRVERSEVAAPISGVATLALAAKSTILNLSIGGELRLSISLSAITAIFLGSDEGIQDQRSDAPGSPTLSQRLADRQVTLHLASAVSDSELHSGIVSFLCRDEPDFEAWSFCLSRLAHVSPKWRSPLRDSDLDDLPSAEREFCESAHISAEAFRSAVAYIDSLPPATGVSILALRCLGSAESGLSLLQAESLCAFWSNRSGGAVKRRQIWIRNGIR